jgi:hypothetical protein
MYSAGKDEGNMILQFNWAADGTAMISVRSVVE